MRRKRCITLLRLTTMRGLFVQLAVYWALVGTLAVASVTTWACWVLQALLALAFWGSYRWRPSANLTPRSWVRLAIYSVLGAASFAGANFAMDALHGAHRPKAEVASHLGGLELWFVLCPGVFSLALGRLAGRSTRAVRPRRLLRLTISPANPRAAGLSAKTPFALDPERLSENPCKPDN
jgi:hypothetical protein